MPLESSMQFSIKHELKSRWGASHTPNIRIPGWPRLLLDMRAFWCMGVETVLETKFYEPVKMQDHNEENKSL